MLEAWLLCRYWCQEAGEARQGQDREMSLFQQGQSGFATWLSLAEWWVAPQTHPGVQMDGWDSRDCRLVNAPRSQTLTPCLWFLQIEPFLSKIYPGEIRYFTFIFHLWVICFSVEGQCPLAILHQVRSPMWVKALNMSAGSNHYICIYKGIEVSSILFIVYFLQHSSGNCNCMYACLSSEFPWDKTSWAPPVVWQMLEDSPSPPLPFQLPSSLHLIS